jgi:DNA-binding winged helix-turn-helix (wHTH) protein/tetratricopeptide (TPR) repeat protein
MARWRVGEWVVDGSDGTVASGDCVVRLEPRLMALLLALVERRGTVVPQEVLLGTVWAGTHLAPGALARAVSEIRTALGDDSRQARYVETVPKRGYRLIAPVEEIAAASPGSAATPAPDARPRRRWRSLPVAALALLAALALVHGIRRPSAGAPRRYAPSRLMLTPVSREWNETAFTLNSRAVALDPSSADAHARLALTYAARASYLSDRGRWAALSLEAATRATQLDSGNANAASALGTAYALAGRLGSAAVEYRRALHLNPNDADAAIALGHALMLSGHVTEALGLYEQQITAFPRSGVGYAYLAEGLSVVGYPALSVQAARAAIALEPHARVAQRALVRDDLLGGRHDSARLRLERMLEVSPDCSQCLVQLGLIEQLGGQRQRAEARYRAAHAIWPPFPPAALRLAHLKVAEGRRTEAEALLGEVEAAARAEIGTGSEQYYPRWQLAVVAALRGDGPSAIDWYAQAVALGRRDSTWDQWEPLLVVVRRQKPFAALQDPFRAEHQAAARLVSRLASLLGPVTEPLGLLTRIPDPPGWPADR